MYECKVSDLALMLVRLAIARRDAKHADLAGNGTPSAHFKESMVEMLDDATRIFSSIDLEPAVISQLHLLKDGIVIGNVDLRPSVLEARLGVFIECIHHSLSRRMFMYMPAEDASYWNNHELFSLDALLVFPKKEIMEMREAGNCMAASLYTASVFHSMRVAEYGLRLLARRVSVRLTDKHMRRLPIEYADWNKVIDGIRTRIRKLRERPKGPTQERRLQFCSDAADHCEYMKDIWRNEASHSRRLYSQTEAVGALNRVRDFINLLVTNEIPPKDSREYVDRINKRMNELEKGRE